MTDTRVIELQCNVDDMTAEQIAFAIETFLAAGANDAYATPITMKKSRPAMLLTVMCTEAQRDDMLQLIFRHTSTIGIREVLYERYVLDRTETVVDTPHGKVRRKDASGYGIRRSKYEFEDVAAIARKLGISYAEALAFAESSDKDQ